MGVNCLPPSNVPACLPVLSACDLPTCVYANLGEPTDSGSGFRSEECHPTIFAERARQWIDAGVRLVGGCCGTTPSHVEALAHEIGR